MLGPRKKRRYEMKIVRFNDLVVKEGKDRFIKTQRLRWAAVNISRIDEREHKKEYLTLRPTLGRAQCRPKNVMAR